jgi:hypothetical protein
MGCRPATLSRRPAVCVARMVYNFTTRRGNTRLPHALLLIDSVRFTHMCIAMPARLR